MTIAASRANKATRALSDAELLADGVYSIAKAAEFADVSTDTIRRMIADGLPSVMVRGALRVPKRALHEHLAARLIRTDRVS